MVEPDEVTLHEYFCTVGSGLENFVVNELVERRCIIQRITSGKVYFSSNISPKALLSLKTAERLFILVRSETQFLINRTKRDAIRRFRSMVEGDSVHHWVRCLNKWKEFYKVLTLSECDDVMKFRVSCKCSGKTKKAFPSFFLGKILAGSLLNIHSKWIPELRKPQLEILVHADMDSITIGLACCLFNQPLSKRPYLIDVKGHAILRPTICSAMLTLAFETDRVAQLSKNLNSLNEPIILLDPMCGTGMILAEAAVCDAIPDSLVLLGSDSDATQVSEAVNNIGRAKDMQKANINYNRVSEGIKKCSTELFVADARALPLQDKSVHCIVSDLPFGLKHTCKPWPTHSRKVIAKLMNVKDNIQSVPSECKSNQAIKINDCSTSNNEVEEKNINQKVYTDSDSIHGVTVYDDIDASKLNSSNSCHSKRGVKRTNPCAAFVSDSKALKVSCESNTIEDARNMLPEVIIEMDRVLVQGGRVVLIISETLKPCLLEAVNFVTSPTKTSMWCNNTDTIDSGEGTSANESTTASNLESKLSSQKSIFELQRSRENNYLESKRHGWLCTQEHKVRLGMLNAVICAFNA